MRIQSKILSGLFMSSGVSLVVACTLFARFNSSDGSLLIAKNRDNHPDRQIVEVVSEPHKYKYLALSRQDSPDFVSAGVNEKNLAAFNEVTIEYASKVRGGISDDFTKDILQNYSSAVDVIKDLPNLVNKFPDPVFYQVADNRHILAIEVAPNHHFKYQLQTRGEFAHSNNYQQSSLIENYVYTSKEQVRLVSSKTRVARAEQLLSQMANPSLLSLQKIGLDHSADFNNSILRGGDPKNPNSVRSLAFFGVKLFSFPAASQVLINLYNVGETYNLQLNQQFWKNFGGSHYQLVAADAH